jgi:hypothetical protein
VSATPVAPAQEPPQTITLQGTPQAGAAIRPLHHLLPEVPACAGTTDWGAASYKHVTPAQAGASGRMERSRLIAVPASAGTTERFA